MGRLLARIGRIVFWLLWPFWVVYFRVSPDRTRIFVVADNKLLLIRTWLGADAWGLPGGGVKRGESLEDAAVRELREETGIKTMPELLNHLGEYRRTVHGLRYTAHYFVLRLDETIPTKGQILEVAETSWIDKSELKDLNTNHDAAYGLSQYEQKFWYND